MANAVPGASKGKCCWRHWGLWNPEEGFEAPTLDHPDYWRIMHDLTRAAIAYLAEGFHLLVVNGKRPNPRYHETWDWDNSIHGLPESDEDEAALDALFSSEDVTGIAVLIPQHVLVADIDTEEAAVLFQTMCADEADYWQTSRIGKSANGLHVWMLAPGFVHTTWLGGRTLLFKGFGGYVVVAPSIHPSGVAYEWIGDWRLLEWAPERLLRALREKEDAGVTTTYKAPRRVIPQIVDGHWTGLGWGEDDVSLDGLCKAIIEAADGNQNNVIHWAACVARDDGVPLEVAMERLLAAAIQGNHPEHRARDTIRGAYKRRPRD